MPDANSAKSALSALKGRIEELRRAFQDRAATDDDDHASIGVAVLDDVLSIVDEEAARLDATT